MPPPLLSDGCFKGRYPSMEVPMEISKVPTKEDSVEDLPKDTAEETKGSTSNRIPLVETVDLDEDEDTGQVRATRKTQDQETKTQKHSQEQDYKKHGSKVQDVEFNIGVGDWGPSYDFDEGPLKKYQEEEPRRSSRLKKSKNQPIDVKKMSKSAIRKLGLSPARAHPKNIERALHHKNIFLATNQKEAKKKFEIFESH